jgi:hypothetical protein
MNALEKLREVTDTIGRTTNGLVIVDSWTLAGRLLERFPVDGAERKRLLAAKDHPALDAMVVALENPAPKAQAPDEPPVTEGDMTAAIKAFRKRLKLIRLDQESKLGGRHTSGGKKSDVDAILPPNEFPPRVWKALEAAGRLTHTGSGFYMEPQPGNAGHKA